MLKRLETYALRADLSALNALLSERTLEDDPTGYLQFSARKRAVEEKLASVESLQHSAAGVALFFGGEPVTGSYGINADFSGSALANFQAVVSTMAASHAGRIGSRGPVRQSDQTRLMVTDIARGSMGFILEEEGDSASLFDTPLKIIVDESIDTIRGISSPDEHAFIEATADVDERVVISLRNFFKTLSDAKATMRVTSDNADFPLMQDDLRRAYERMRGLEIRDTLEVKIGRLWVLPVQRRIFELELADGTVVSGTAQQGALEPTLDLDGTARAGMIGNEFQRVQLLRRDAIQAQRVIRSTYKLIAVLGAAPHDTPNARTRDTEAEE